MVSVKPNKKRLSKIVRIFLYRLTENIHPKTCFQNCKSNNWFQALNRRAFKNQ